MDEFEKREDETIEAYTLRIGTACTEKRLTWEKASEYLNKASGTQYGECKFRKNFKSWKSGYDYALSNIDHNSIKSDINKLNIEMVKLRDERIALNKLQRDIARAERIGELIQETITPYNSDTFLNVVQYKDSGNDLIICVSDAHAGLSVRSVWNDFDMETLKERFELYISKIYNIVILHQIETVHIVLLGDLINGHIHINSRVTNNETAIKQLMSISELISNFIKSIYKVCVNIHVYSVSGNHARLFPSKEEQVPGDDLEALIPFYLKARFSECESIKIEENELDSTFGAFRARGNLVIYTHGDKDTPQNVVERLTMMIKQPIDIILMGHRHTNSLKTVQGTKVIESGSMCGVDNYAIGLRKNDVPQQVVAVVNDDGLKCLYNIELNKEKNIKI